MGLEKEKINTFNIISYFQIEKVYDQFVHFISLEHSMFTLRHQTNYSAPNNLSFYSLNKAEMTDTEMDAITDDIVNGLFAVCVTLGTIPVIRCPKNGAAEYVSKKLDKKLRENLRDTRNSLFLNEGGMQGGGQFSFHRPLLVRHFLNFKKSEILRCEG